MIKVMLKYEIELEINNSNDLHDAITKAKQLVTTLVVEKGINIALDLIDVRAVKETNLFISKL